MRSSQIAGIYGGGGSFPTGSRPTGGGTMGKRAVPGNVNVSKPSNQKEALQMLNNMMNQRVSAKKDTQQRSTGNRQQQSYDLNRF